MIKYKNKPVGICRLCVCTLLLLLLLPGCAMQTCDTDTDEKRLIYSIADRDSYRTLTMTEEQTFDDSLRVCYDINRTVVVAPGIYMIFQDNYTVEARDIIVLLCKETASTQEDTQPKHALELLNDGTIAKAIDPYVEAKFRQYTDPKDSLLVTETYGEAFAGTMHEYWSDGYLADAEGERHYYCAYSFLANSKAYVLAGISLTDDVHRENAKSLVTEVDAMMDKLIVE